MIAFQTLFTVPDFVGTDVTVDDDDGVHEVEDDDVNDDVAVEEDDGVPV